MNHCKASIHDDETVFLEVNLNISAYCEWIGSKQYIKPNFEEHTSNFDQNAEQYKQTSIYKEIHQQKYKHKYNIHCQTMETNYLLISSPIFKSLISTNKTTFARTSILKLEISQHSTTEMTAFFNSC